MTDPNGFSPSVRALANTLAIQSKSGKTTRMDQFLWSELLKITPTPLVEAKDGNIYVTKGQAKQYPCVVAHTDTVHDILPDGEFIVYVDRGHLFGWNPKLSRWEGVGGDDKVGIWIALEALRSFDVLKVAFFRDEEWGCQGSNKADLAFFKDTTLVLQADRKGNDEFVRRAAGTKLHGDGFAAAIKPILERYGYKSIDYGGMTDVMKLRDLGMEVSSANMSCGYHEPHGYREWVDIEEAERARDLIFEIITTLGSTKWPWTIPKVSKVKRWPRVPERYLDPRYRQAIVGGICPGCHAPEQILWDSDDYEWFCANCVAWLPEILTKLGKSTNTLTAWSEDARVSLYACYEQAAIQHIGCIACGCKDPLDWPDHADDITCTQCGLTFDEVVRNAVEGLTLETPPQPVVVEPKEGA